MDGLRFIIRVIDDDILGAGRHRVAESAVLSGEYRYSFTEDVAIGNKHNRSALYTYTGRTINDLTGNCACGESAPKRLRMAKSLSDEI